MKENPEYRYFDHIEDKPNSLLLLTVVNFIFGGLSFFYFSFFYLILFYGLFFSGDPTGDKIAGAIGCQCLGFPGLIGSILFTSSAIGVMKLRGWGYYVQMATAVLSILSIIGIPYGLPALLTLLRPEIKELFSRCRYEEKKYLPPV